ncbi:hypothetical protein [Pedobacter duraquae]|uniref:Uncharacterized protein n=1 Tax=Pedobacter duraquae TaxID=425511 RepID=A0A4R6ICJ4_9SPHI|nr:hypothetical protein [Pedobacter duraquae]TDO19331.1 hypothetical protein CLV32_4571 [Pedobacter duraquae]
MEYTLTVQQAIEQGRKQLRLPRIVLLVGAFICVGPLALLSLIVINYSDQSRNALLIVACITLLAFLLFVYLPFRYWSKNMITWKLWAFANCGDVHELQKDAQLAGLYFDDNSLVGRLISTTPADRATWITLKDKFKNPGKFVDDPAVPNETVIGISWGHWLFNFIFQLLGIGLATIVLLDAPSDIGWFGRILSGGLILALFYTMFLYIRDMLIRKPVLIIGNKGIQTVQSGFHSWEDIRNERIILRSTGRGAQSSFLCFDYNNGSEDLKLTLYAISRIKLTQLLYVYRSRYENNATVIIN